MDWMRHKTTLGARIRTILLCLFTLLPLGIWSQGIPFIRNYSPDEYGAHNRNYDILTKDDGTVFVANFEGLLYYDNAYWHTLHTTPNVTNLTSLYLDHSGTVWAGGYNYIGRVVTLQNGQLSLQPLGHREWFSGEVMKIWERNGKLTFLVNDGMVYQASGDSVKAIQRTDNAVMNAGLTDAVEVVSKENDYNVVMMSERTQREVTDDGITVEIRKNNGLVVTLDGTGREYSISERNGLCSDNVNKVAYNGHGLLWGATDNGLFCIAIPSAFSYFTPMEGLLGEVLSITNFNGKIYAGTTEGLFRLEADRSFQRQSELRYACWQLLEDRGRLLVASDNGIYSLAATGHLQQLTTVSCLSLFRDGNTLYIGEADGVTVGEPGSKGRVVCQLPFVNKIFKDGKGTIWLQNIYGKIWRKTVTDSAFIYWQQDTQDNTPMTLVMTGESVLAITAEQEKPFGYPMFSHADADGSTWLTDSEGKNLYCWKNNQRQAIWNKFLSPLREMTVRTIWHFGQEVWIGNQNGLTIVDAKAYDAALNTRPQLRIRSVRLDNDSVLLGCYATPEAIQLSSRERNLNITYGVDFTPLTGTTMYHYRLNDETWTAWTTEQTVRLYGMAYGNYTLEVQARLSTGELSNVATLDFSIALPFYLRWYMGLFYALLLVLLAYGVFRLRLRRLKREKLKLESTVKERTAEIREKSQSLEKALADLSSTQNELIRSEKMATVGKLTQGLVDRILNPLNYITNFSKLSTGLAHDIRQNIDDEREHMDAETYDDTADMLDTLEDNLKRVDQHGQNTTRVLKAMNEILQDRNTNIAQVNLTDVLQQCVEDLHKQHAKNISTYTISVETELPHTPLTVMGNATALTKAIGNLLDNGVYAITKKSARHGYEARLELKATIASENVIMTVCDNGIGIEKTIIEKVFDPFFTTKPTSEAPGIGLYITREIIQNHQGTVDLRSEKGLYTEVTITLPLCQE